jgi:hypothetical protein
MKDWLKEQLQRGQIEYEHQCICGKHSKNGYGFFCFLHKKQTPNKKASEHEG